LKKREELGGRSTMTSHELLPRVFRINFKLLGMVLKALHNYLWRNAKEERLFCNDYAGVFTTSSGSKGSEHLTFLSP